VFKESFLYLFAEFLFVFSKNKIINNVPFFDRIDLAIVNVDKCFFLWKSNSDLTCSLQASHLY